MLENRSRNHMTEPTFYPLEKIEALSPKYIEALKAVGFETTEELLNIGQLALPVLEDKTKIPIKFLDKLVEIVDLMRIENVTEEYGDILNQIGIDSVKEFRHRNPASTMKKIKEQLEKTPGILKIVPTEKDVAAWIENAKALPNLDIN